jgi:hypothetical protein
MADTFQKCIKEKYFNFYNSTIGENIREHGSIDKNDFPAISALSTCVYPFYKYIGNDMCADKLKTDVRNSIYYGQLNVKKIDLVLDNYTKCKK